MNRPLTIRWRRPGRPGALVWAVCAVVGLVVAVSVVVRDGGPPEADALAASLGSAAAQSSGPGFPGVVSDSAPPVGDAAPAAPHAPLAGPDGTGAAPTRPVYALADHPLFAQHAGLGRVDCALPAWRDTSGAAQAFYTAALTCLDAAWEPALRGAGLPFRAPRLNVPNSAEVARASCGADRPEAFYCAVSETIVIPLDASRPTVAGSRRGAQLALLAHEYAHHVQNLIGVDRAYRDHRTDLGWEGGEGALLGRRLELQAGCFAGMFFGVNDGRGDLDRPTWQEAARHTRGARDDNAWGWWKWGSDKGDAFECNTWYAAEQNVA
ncbi:neutral zinc metallopeptidase [Nocardia puris]|uniref:Neutral zinc metallopeptidase n=1 Tax=Nocardia puris TaxID=208602 RepID=A0A366DJB6_9NOCA|nr:neutral zinc metallopeptidase [Nocardia puris]MBF6369823.1 neutral zinc metallopeptidase [Nocardia puris]RBO89414.1 hypothetical protein DFR74_10792 [Nocardia puris]